MSHTSEVAVIGAGPAGLATALALARLGISVAIVSPPYDAARAASRPANHRADRPERRSAGKPRCMAALRCRRRPAQRRPHRRRSGGHRAGARGCFRRSRAWSGELRRQHSQSDAACRAQCCSRRQRRGYARVATSAVTGIEPGNASVRLTLAEGGSVTAKLAVAADGRKSIAPAAAGIAVRAWNYQQAAIVTSFGHTRPHSGTVNELHRRAGPLTTVPLPGSCSSLVWVEEPHEAHRIANLADDAFRRTAGSAPAGRAGHHPQPGPAPLYPLSGSRTERMAARRIALVGEAAHVIPPIGAQGLNLGLRDAAALAECVADAQALGQDIGGAEVLAAYQRCARRRCRRAIGRHRSAQPVVAHRFPARSMCCGGPRCTRCQFQRAAPPPDARRTGCGGTLPRLMRPHAPTAST